MRSSAAIASGSPSSTTNRSPIQSGDMILMADGPMARQLGITRIGQIVSGGVEHAVRKGSIVHIPPGVVHGAVGRMRVLVVGVPDIADDDLFYPDNQ